jgi:hypothetical protein
MKEEGDEIHCVGKDLEGSEFYIFPNTIPEVV